MDGNAKLWNADQAYSVGNYGYVGGGTYNNTSAISGTNDDPLYHDGRYGFDAYQFDVNNGLYQVSLHFAEVFKDNLGERVFDIRIEGQTLISNFDIVSAAGKFAAVVKTFGLQVNDGQINIVFFNVAEYPIISAIEVVGTGTVDTKSFQKSENFF